MRLRLVLLASLVSSGAALAADCTLYNARYKQPDAAWFLTFQRVPEMAAPNQTAAFYLELANSGVTLDGAVHVPNGYGSPLWSISGPCSAEDGAGECTFLGEGSTPAIYGLYAGQLSFLRSERGSVAPDQVLLPQLSASLWYSHYRQEEWFDGASPGDAFELVGCD